MDPASRADVRRLLLVRHAPTARRARRVPGRRAARRARPRRRRALAAALPRAARCCRSPALRCRQTAAAAGLTVAAVEPRVAECDFGAWAGRTLADVHAPSPDAARRLDDRPGRRAARRREPARVRGARGRLARRAGGARTARRRDHPRRRRQGGGRARAGRAARGVLADRRRAARASPSCTRTTGRWTVTRVNVPRWRRRPRCGVPPTVARGRAGDERRGARRRLRGGRCSSATRARLHPVAGFGRVALAAERVGLRADRGARRRSTRARSSPRRRSPPSWPRARPARCAGRARRPGAGHLGRARRALAGARGAQARRGASRRDDLDGRARGAAVAVRARPRGARRGRALPRGGRVGRREHRRRRRRRAVLGRGRRAGGRRRLPRGQHARRDGRPPQRALRARSAGPPRGSTTS